MNAFPTGCAVFVTPLTALSGTQFRQKQPKGSQVRRLSASWVEKAWLQECEAAGPIASAVRNKEMKAEDQFTFM